METPRVFGMFLCARKITLETQFYTVSFTLSVCWGLLDERFSQTLVLWYGLRRRKWHFWTILDCSVYESFRTDKKSSCLWHHCVGQLGASLIERNVFRVKSGLVTASKWWLELCVHRRQQRADNGLNSPANQDAADQMSCIYLPLSELKYPLFYMAWGCDISSIISSIISKRQCLHDGYVLQSGGLVLPGGTEM